MTTVFQHSQPGKCFHPSNANNKGKLTRKRSSFSEETSYSAQSGVSAKRRKSFLPAPFHDSPMKENMTSNMIYEQMSDVPVACQIMMGANENSIAHSLRGGLELDRNIYR